jgi:hypothetical protein
MAWTLAELSKIETDPLRKSIVDTLLMESDVAQLCPWETIGQLATTIVKYKDLPSVGFRLINAGYTEATGHFTQKVENIALMGGMIDTDKAIARAKNTVADARATMQQMMVKAMAYNFNDKFINGSPVTTPTEFKGIKERVDDEYAAGYTDCYIDGGGAGTNRGFLYDTAARNLFLNNLDKLIYAIPGHKPDILFMNKKTLLAVRSLLRLEKLLDTSRDMFDRQIDMYSGARLVDIGVKADQTTEIITNTESVSGGSEESSIYAVKFGVGEFLWGIQEYPMEADDKGLLEDKPVYRTEVDWPLGLAHVHQYSCARLYGFVPDSDAS